MRIVGLDIHRVFAEAVTLDGNHVLRLGRIGMTREHLAVFAKGLTHDDHIVIEATGNAAAEAEALAPHVARVVIANPRQVRLTAEARIKDGVIDATVLARLYERLHARGLGAGRAHTSVAMTAHATNVSRPTARSAEDNHPVYSARASRAALPACGPARTERPHLAARADAAAG